MDDWNRISDEIAALNANLTQMAAQPREPIQTHQANVSLAELMQLMQRSGAPLASGAASAQNWNARGEQAVAPSSASPPPAPDPQPRPATDGCAERVRVLEGKVSALTGSVENLVHEIRFMTQAMVRVTAAQAAAQVSGFAVERPPEGTEPKGGDEQQRGSRARRGRRGRRRNKLKTSTTTGKSAESIPLARHGRAAEAFEARGTDDLDELDVEIDEGSAHLNSLHPSHSSGLNSEQQTSTQPSGTLSPFSST